MSRVKTVLFLLASMMFAGILSAETLVLQYGGVEVEHGTVFDLQNDIRTVYGYQYDLSNYILKEVKVLAKDKPFDGKNAYLNLNTCGSYAGDVMVSGSQNSTHSSNFLWTSLNSSCYNNNDSKWYLRTRNTILLEEIRLYVEEIGYSQPTPSHDCPWGYHWSYTHNTCVKDVVDNDYQNCPYGYHWSYTHNTCVKDVVDNDYQNCPYGYHWSYSLNKCVKDYAPPPPHSEDHNCRPGWHWDPSTHRCVRDSDYDNDYPPYNPNPNHPGVCPMGKVWSELFNMCI